MTAWPVHGRITGPIVMIGFGSIGKGTLPLIERHFEYDKSRIVVIDPEDKDRKLLDERGFDLVLTDLKMPGLDGMAILRKVRAEQPEVEVIVMTAHGTVDNAVEAFIGDYVDGSVQGGTDIVNDLSTEGVGLATSGGYIDDIQGQLDDYRQQIIDGDIEDDEEA